MAGYVYLICDPRNDYYKIGVTKGSIEKRLKSLQTGNGTELHVVAVFPTKTPFKLEKMLHLKFGLKRETGEWFTLSDDEVPRFKEICEEVQKTVDSLMDNPYYNKESKLSCSV